MVEGLRYGPIIYVNGNTIVEISIRYTVVVNKSYKKWREVNKKWLLT